MRKISADYVFTLNTDPIKNGILIISDDGTIIDILSAEESSSDKDDIEVFEGFLSPGFINTHCHLELSHLKNTIPPHRGLDNFIDTLEKLKASCSYDDILSAMEKAEEDMINNGIVAVGDISNTSDSFSVKEKSKLVYHTFIEIYGSNPAQADEIFERALSLYEKLRTLNYNNKGSIVPHSAYSVSQALFKKIKEFSEAKHNILSLHHQENEDENLFFSNRSGNIVKRMQRFGVDISKFKASGQRPIESVTDYLPKYNPIQFVHNTVSREKDILFAKSNFNEVYFCLCPNANIYIEHKLPDVMLFMESGAVITIGTDGAVSNSTLSILEEIKTISQNFPGISLNDKLKWACLNGADLLGIGDTFGSFERSKRPGINLIENVDLNNISLRSDSRIQVIA